MNFPSLNDINFLNYLLMVVDSLDNINKSCSISRVKRVCSSRVYHGILVDYSKVIELGRKTKMLMHDKRNIKLTSIGMTFLQLNENSSFQISESQSVYFLEECAFNGPWEAHTRDFFLLFSPNHDLVTYEFSTFENPLPTKYNAIFHTLKSMKVVQEENNIVRVASSFVQHVKRIRAREKGLSESELKEILESDEKLALLAEERVLDYERKRLILLGRIIEAKAVKKISNLDVTAGYDIKSFNGNIPEIEHSRFIEVKASKQGKMRFFWSVNEYNVAEKLGDQYWIYYLGEFNDTKTEIEPIMIQNPAKRIGEIKELKMGVSKYIITEEEPLTLKKIDIEIKGFVL